jgi:5-methylthioadenosine/S-adenosylhomocysteine deaminase
VDCVERHGVRPAAYLDQLGVLGERTVLAHGVWLDQEELALIADLKVFALAQRHANDDPTILPAREAWEVATGAQAPLLASELHQLLPPAGGEVDAVRVGGPADFLLLRAGSPELGLGDLYSDLVYAASGSIVGTTVVGGRVLMQGGEVAGSEEIVARAVERSHRLGISA